MTRKEAIEWLKEHHSTDLQTQSDEAHRMAIKSLEAWDKVIEALNGEGAYEQEVYGNTKFLYGINHCLSIINACLEEIENDK